MKSIFFSFILLLLFINARAQNNVSHASITFKIKNMGIGTSGTIGGMQTNIHFNPADLAASVLEASVETSTLNTDNTGRDEHIKSEDFFDVARYPKITLKSIELKHKSGNKYLGKFNLTIKNKTRVVEFPFTYSQTGNTEQFAGSFTINRLDFGIGTESMILANDVTINIDAAVNK